MDEEIVNEVMNALSAGESVQGDKALPLEPSQTPVPISLEHFEELPGTSSRTITFIDGGNAELLGAASFSLQFIRIGAVTYQGRKKKDRDKEEFYLLIKFSEGDFEVKTFPNNKLPEVSFDSLDPRLRTGNERVVASKVGGVCRRLAELKFATKFNDSDYVVLDGDLYARSSQEENLLKELKGNNAVVCGVSKTTGLMTEKGRVFAAALSSIKQGEWHYAPVFNDGNIDVSFARLHSSSDYVFRIDSFDKAGKQGLLGILKALSTDPVFPGYPYPLVEVDRLARITNKEKEYMKTKFMTRFGKAWKDVKTYLHTKDAHGVLDNIG